VHKFSIEKNLKQIQGRKPCIQKIEYSQHTKKKQHIKIYIQKYGKKELIYSKTYSPIQSSKVQILKYLQEKNKKMVE
jgi:hypothetical protein